MEGVIVNFRRGRHRTHNYQMVMQVEGYDKEKSKSLIGKSVIWTSPAGKELKGKVSAVHGNKGAVRVIFETGMPGQAIGQKVKIQ